VKEQPLGREPTLVAAQARLTVGDPNDRFEQEADRVADQVLCGTPLVANERQRPQIRRQPNASAPATSIGGVPVGDGASASSGRPLDAQTRAFFEPRFRHDFSHVRVFDDATAAATASGLGARAFTVGSAITFARGQYAPETLVGQRLLAHELTHVIQQSRGDIGPRVQRAPDDDPVLALGGMANAVVFETKQKLNRWHERQVAAGRSENLGAMYPLTADNKLEGGTAQGGHVARAILRFQSYAHIKADGAIHQSTVDKLDADLASAPPPPTATTATAPAAPPAAPVTPAADPVLALGSMSGPVVLATKQKLNRWHELSVKLGKPDNLGPLYPLTNDDRLDRGTAQGGHVAHAIMIFQRVAGLKIDGAIHQSTVDKLDAALKALEPLDPAARELREKQQAERERAARSEVESQEALRQRFEAARAALEKAVQGQVEAQLRQKFHSVSVERMLTLQRDEQEATIHAIVRCDGELKWFRAAEINRRGVGVYRPPREDSFSLDDIARWLPSAPELRSHETPSVGIIASLAPGYFNAAGALRPPMIPALAGHREWREMMWRANQQVVEGGAHWAMTGTIFLEGVVAIIAGGAAYAPIIAEVGPFGAGAVTTEVTTTGAATGTATGTGGTVAAIANATRLVAQSVRVVGYRLVNIVLTNPEKAIRWAEWGYGTLLSIGMAGGVKEFLQSLETPEGAIQFGLTLIHLKFELRMADGSSRSVRVPAVVQEPHSETELPVKVAGPPQIEGAPNQPQTLPSNVVPLRRPAQPPQGAPNEPQTLPSNVVPFRRPAQPPQEPPPEAPPMARAVGDDVTPQAGPQLRVIEGGGGSGDRPVSAASKQQGGPKVVGGSTSTSKGSTAKGGGGAAAPPPAAPPPVPTPLQNARTIAQQAGLHVEVGSMTPAETQAAGEAYTLSQQRNRGATGSSFHTAIGAAERGPDFTLRATTGSSGMRRIVEVKTSLNGLTVEGVQRAWSQAMGYVRSQSAIYRDIHPHPIVIIYDFSTGTKFVFSKFPLTL
jgi:hypothetical protein